MSTYNGYTKELSEIEKRRNEIAGVREILAANPGNGFWQARLAALLEVDPICCCYEVMGDNENCPEHGGMFKDHGQVMLEGTISNVTIHDHTFTQAEVEADYRERRDLYTQGMGG